MVKVKDKICGKTCVVFMLFLDDLYICEIKNGKCVNVFIYEKCTQSVKKFNILCFERLCALCKTYAYLDTNITNITPKLAYRIQKILGVTIYD